MSFEQKRSAERLPLDAPLEATASGMAVKIIELSAIGCKIEHREKLSIGSSTALRFRWRGEEIDLRARVARTQLRSAYPRGMIYESGLQFADLLENAPEVIRRILASFAEPELPPPVAQAAQLPPAVQVAQTAPIAAMVQPAAPPFIREMEFDEEIEASQEIDESEEIEPAPEPIEEPPPEEPELRYVECSLEEGVWRRRLVATTLQPPDGFITVPADDKELDLLCKTYEVADPDTRRLIRISLELHATKKRD